MTLESLWVTKKKKKKKEKTSSQAFSTLCEKILLVFISILSVAFKHSCFKEIIICSYPKDSSLAPSSLLFPIVCRLFLLQATKSDLLAQRSVTFTKGQELQQRLFEKDGDAVI